MGAVLVLLAVATQGPGIKVGLSTTEQFSTTPESVTGQAVLASASFAALGISWVIVQHAKHFPAGVPVPRSTASCSSSRWELDYNFFLTSRAKEETLTLGTAKGMLAARRSTGGVITSAGTLLTSVVAVLDVWPLIQLTQNSIVVFVGVLIDTLLERTVLVPALAVWLSDRFWWPRRR